MHSASEVLPRICVAVAAPDPERLLATAAGLVPEFPFLEFRLDSLPDPAEAFAPWEEWRRRRPEGVFLATCRRVVSGGGYAGSAEDEVRMLLRAARAGFALVDLSLESAEELGPPAVAQLRAAGVRVVVSFHDFQRTPDLQGVVERMLRLAPDLYKIVPTAERLADSLDVLQLLRSAPEAAEGRLVAMAMGEAGAITRVLGPKMGSAFTFAAASEAEATAPGQFTARTLTQLFRADKLTSATQMYGVAGDPIRSSLSPLMLNTAFQQAGWEGVYVPLKTADVAELFRCARELPLAGFSVTMPLKQEVVPFLDAVDPLAAKIGAVNTVKRNVDGTFAGFNTDAAGIVAPLEERLPLRGARVLVLGAGGAARAAVFGCMDRGAEVFISNRTLETASRLAEESGAQVLAREALAHEDFDVLIQATPAGMRGQALALPIAEHELRAKLVFDLVYNPLETPLLAVARAQGREVIAGVEMFVHQGAAQFAHWTGQSAPVDAMRQVVLQHLLASASQKA